jgi:TonB family protein
MTHLFLALLLATQPEPPPILRAPIDRAHLPGVARPVAPRPPAAAPAAREPSRAVPTVPLFRLISADDYPAAALRAAEQGNVRVRLDVAPEGRVSGCTITGSSGSSALDSTTCRILASRARFTPARSASGQAVADRFETTVAWRIPAPNPAPPELTAAAFSWLECLQATVRPGWRTTMPATLAMAEKAFAACRPAEDVFLAEAEAASSVKRPVEEVRALLRADIVRRLYAARQPR